MLRFKSLFCRTALSCVKPNTTRIPLIPRFSCIRHPQCFLTEANSARYFSKKITDLDQMGSIVDMHYLVADKTIDQTRSSNPIIILHGLLGSKENWQSIARQLNLRTGRKVYAVDFRNHGTSPHTYVFSYEFMVCDLIFFMRLNYMNRATLIGHSMGGRVAMMLAMRYPELVQSLIVVDISPVGISPKMKTITQLLKDLKNLQLDRHLTLKEARKQTAVQLREKEYDEKFINFILMNLVENEFRTNWRWKFNLDSILENYKKEILFFPIVSSPCTNRTLFIGGGDSDYDLLLLKRDEKFINFILMNLVENEFRTNWRWKFNLDSILENYEKEILFFPIVSSPCTNRTLFIGGGDSDYITPRHEEHIRNLFPDAEFSYIAGAGHWVHADKPVEFLDIVVEFLEKDPTKIQEDAERHPLGRPVDLAFQKYDDHYDESKSDVPIIILHGLLGSKQNWNSMARHINKKVGRVVYTLDARNHGESPHTEIFTYDMMMGDLLVFCRKQGISRATIIGHSMGGRVAMLMAMVYPVLVHSMVVVDMSPGGPSANMKGIRQLLGDLKNLNLDPKLTPREARTQAAIQLRENVKDERVIAFILTNLVENTSRLGRNWRWKFNLDSIIKYFDSDIVDYPVSKRDCGTRSLFIGGADSDFIKPSDEVHIRKIFPKSQFEYVEGAGHWVHAEKPVEFLEIVAKFLDKDP